jgi:hypothetical protein
MSEYLFIRSLISATYNQDWMIDFSDWKICLLDELSRGSRGWKEDLRNEINAMEMDMDDAEIEAFFRVNCAEIEPPYHAGITYRAWLHEVCELIDNDLSDFSSG